MSEADSRCGDVGAEWVYDPGLKEGSRGRTREGKISGKKETGKRILQRFEKGSQMKEGEEKRQNEKVTEARQ